MPAMGISLIYLLARFNCFQIYAKGFEPQRHEGTEFHRGTFGLGDCCHADLVEALVNYRSTCQV